MKSSANPSAFYTWLSAWYADPAHGHGQGPGTAELAEQAIRPGPLGSGAWAFMVRRYGREIALSAVQAARRAAEVRS